MKIESHSASLEFEIVGRETWGEVLFIARFRDKHFSGETAVSDFQAGPPDQLFAEMAANWRGWEGALEWSEHESRLSLSATNDGRGHVALTVTIWRYLDPEAKLVAPMMLDVGALDGIAEGMKALFA